MQCRIRWDTDTKGIIAGGNRKKTMFKRIFLGKWWGQIESVWMMFTKERNLLPSTAGVPYGHSGQVRFLSAVEVTHFPQATGTILQNFLQPGGNEMGTTRSASGSISGQGAGGEGSKARPRSPSSGSILPLPVFRSSRRNSATLTSSSSADAATPATTGLAGRDSSSSSPALSTSGPKILIISGGQWNCLFRGAIFFSCFFKNSFGCESHFWSNN